MYKLYCDYCGQEINKKKGGELLLYNGLYEHSVGNYLNRWELHKECYDKALTQIKQIFLKDGEE